MSNEPEFYVGYLPKAPAGLAKLMSRATAFLCATGVIAATVLVFAQKPFAASAFEFQQYRPYEGQLTLLPYPVLAIKGAQYLVVSPGKHGLSEGLPDLAGKGVQLQAALIHRSEGSMLELLPGSMKPKESQTTPAVANEDLGVVNLAGEIVDSKCYLGVMNPGEGKVHRDCAARCISGGIPPAFLVRDSIGAARILLLRDKQGNPPGHEILKFVGEPIQISGRLIRQGSLHFLQAEAGDYHQTQ